LGYSLPISCGTTKNQERQFSFLSRPITGILPFADPTGQKAHDAYHRFFPDASWAMSELWRLLTILLVLTLKVNPPWGGEPLGLPILFDKFSAAGTAC